MKKEGYDDVTIKGRSYLLQRLAREGADLLNPESVKEALALQPWAARAFDSDDYATRVSNSVKEDRELIEAGFEYVTERNSVKIYRKPK